MDTSRWPQPRNQRKGFLLLDVLLGITIFSIFVGFASFSLLFSEQLAMKSGDRARAYALSEQALEAARSIRNSGFDELTEGQHGISIQEGTWVLSGTGTVTPDGFTTTVVMEVSSSDVIQVTAQTTWSLGQQRTGTAVLVTELTNWQQERAPGDWSSVSLVGQYDDPGNPPLYTDVSVSGDYAYITGDTESGGPGLTILNITSLTSPVRIAQDFTLGSAGYAVTASEETLFVLTGAGNSELRVYDISDPETFSSASLLGTYDLPGSGRGRSLALYGETLFIGATLSLDSGQDEFFAVDVTDPAHIQPLDSFDDEGDYLSISLHNGYAYIGSSEDVSELVVIDIFDPTDLQLAPGGGYNLTDVLDGTAVQAFGGSVLLGRLYGDFTQELVLFDTEESPVPSPPPGPWYQGVGADVNDIVADPSGMYGFVATSYDDQELEVMDIALFRDGQMPRVASVASEAGDGVGVYYDAQKDRLFFITPSSFQIFAPGS